jgi:hypothetical protein
MVAGAGGSEMPSDTHPPEIVRLALIQGFIQDNHLEIEVRLPLFSLLLDGSQNDSVTLLDSGKIPEILSSQFIERGLALAADVGVKKRKTGEEWSIVDSDNSYIIRNRQDILTILDNSDKNFTDLSSHFFRIIEERTELDRQYHQHFIEKFQPKLPLGTGQFVDVICDQVNNAISLNRQPSSEDFARIEKLATRLSKGILIGSCQDFQLSESERKRFSDGKISPSELDRAKEAIQESRVWPWEIINAGWQHKIQYIYPEAFALFFDSDNAQINEKIEEWSLILDMTDRLLLKSIEVSEIQEIMEGK